jgi:catechol 2,3-dioxygenase-like lactoylglutathione lyase family enzyme
VTSQLLALGFDAEDPGQLARFYAAALGWDVDDGDRPTIALVPTDGTTFRLVFRPGAEPKRGQNRLHLDLTTATVDDQQSTVDQLVAIGGRHIDIGQRPDELHVVLADPEGNELCIIEPQNRFLADCDRLGSITCDGSRAVGCFWSAALGWPLVWDQDEETAVRAPDGRGPMITWGGPPVAPKAGRNRLHLEIAPTDAADVDAEVQRLVSLGATDTGARTDAWLVLVDPDDNELWVRTSG